MFLHIQSINRPRFWYFIYRKIEGSTKINKIKKLDSSLIVLVFAAFPSG